MLNENFIFTRGRKPQLGIKRHSLLRRLIVFFCAVAVYISQTPIPSMERICTNCISVNILDVTLVRAFEMEVTNGELNLATIELPMFSNDSKKNACLPNLPTSYWKSNTPEMSPTC